MSYSTYRTFCHHSLKFNRTSWCLTSYCTNICTYINIYHSALLCTKYLQNSWASRHCIICMWNAEDFLTFSLLIVHTNKKLTKQHYLSWWKSPWSTFLQLWVCVGPSPAAQWSKQCGLPFCMATKKGVVVRVGCRGETKQTTYWSNMVNSHLSTLGKGWSRKEVCSSNLTVQAE